MQILVPHVACMVFEPEFEAASQDNYQIIYVVTPKGTFKHSKLKGGRHVRVKVEAISEIKEEVKMTEEINFLPAGKIPFSLFEEIVQFFRDVMTIKKADEEAMAHILWSPKLGYHIGIPTQNVSKASVSYKYDHLQPDDIIVVDIHSHNTMGSFFSSTDDRDDKLFIGYSGVIGNITESSFTSVWRFNINEAKVKAEMSDMFDIPKKEVKIPSEWLDKVSTGFSYQGKGLPATQWNGYPGWVNGGKGNPRSTEKSGRHTGTGMNGLSDQEYDLLWAGLGDLNYAADDPYENFPTTSEGYEKWRKGNQSPKDANASGQGFGERVFGARPSQGRLILVSGDGAGFPDPEADVEIEAGAADHMDTAEYADHAISHGKEAAEAYEQISIYLQDLNECDELLLKLMGTIYHMMGSETQGRLGESGF